SFLQAPFVSILGPTAIANAIPGVLIGSLVAPLTWLIARDAGARPLVGVAAGVISAVPGAATVFMAQPENFAILHPLVAATLWLTARGLKGDGRSFAIAGLLAGLATLARNDGILLAGAMGLVWLADRVRGWRAHRGRRSWSHVDDRQPISILAGVAALALFLVVMGPWWARQLAVFGSISPTSSSGAARCDPVGRGRPHPRGLDRRPAPQVGGRPRRVVLRLGRRRHRDRLRGRLHAVGVGRLGCRAATADPARRGARQAGGASNRPTAVDRRRGHEVLDRSTGGGDARRPDRGDRVGRAGVPDQLARPRAGRRGSSAGPGAGRDATAVDRPARVLGPHGRRRAAEA